MASRASLRTCIACRQVGEKSELLRFCLVERGSEIAQVCSDERQRMPGRGVYLHSSSECGSRIWKERGLWSRAFRKGVEPLGQEALKLLFGEEIADEHKSVSREGKKGKYGKDSNIRTR